VQVPYNRLAPRFPLAVPSQPSLRCQASASAKSLTAFLTASEPGLETIEERPRCQDLDAKELLQLEQVRVAGENEFRPYRQSASPDAMAALLSPSILREQILQVALRQAARKALFPEHVGDRLRFALLQLPDLFLHGAG
jgi:hypothetical protein